MTDRLAVVRESEFTRCCDRPPPVFDCCGCDGPNGESLMPETWEIQESLEGMYSVEISPGFKQAWGCEGFSSPGVRRLQHYAGPTYQGEPDRTGDCFWQSVHPEPGRCCQFGCTEEGGFGNATTVSAYMGCYKIDAVPPVDPIFQWYLDCACGDLWCGDSSEWADSESCQEYDSNCHCCTEEGSYFSSEDECEYAKTYYEGLGLTCGECTYTEVTPGSPGYPAFVDHVAGLGGPCGCNRQYVFLDPLNPRCKDMLGSVGGTSADLPEFDCDGCNTYHLVQYVGMMVDNVTPCPNYPCALGCVHICNGSDLACTDCCEGWGYYYCLGYPATLTICPASTREGLPTGSASNACDVLCCTEDGEVLEEVKALALDDTEPAPAESVWWEVAGTVTGGYLTKDSESGLYKGGIPPFFLSLDKDKKELNGKALKMLSDDVYWGTVFIGDKAGWQITIMA